MEMNFKKMTIYTLIVVAVTVSTTKYFWPNIETKVKIEEKEVIRNDVKTIIKEVIRKDGSKETVTQIVDRTKKQSEKEVEKITIKPKQYIVGLGVSTDFKSPQPIYSFQFAKRFWGPVFIQGSINTKAEPGIALLYEF